MKIDKGFDVVGREPPAEDKGTSPFENPQIKSSGAPESPGWKASNTTADESMSKSQPFKKKGSGYTG